MANAHLRVLSTGEVAKKMGVTTATIRRFAISGQLKGRKLGERSWVFDEEDVERFIRRYDEGIDPAVGGRPRSGERRKK